MLFRKKPTKNIEALQYNIDLSNIPKHIAIIMDGNGRWAKKRGLPRTFGHRAGVETIKELVKECGRLGVKYLTLYAFSTENWKRPSDEVGALMDLLVEFLAKELKELHENNVIINYIGDISELPEACQRALLNSIKHTSDNSGLRLNLALNYGSRNEITCAVKSIASDVAIGKIQPMEINEAMISDRLFTKGMPDPELLIRPSGEFRISNFLLWQIAYSEFWFSNVLWPDFRIEHLHQAIAEFQKRDRRFGGIKS